MTATLEGLAYGGSSWWEDGREVALLARWLACEKGYQGCQVVDLYEAPWEYDLEWSVYSEEHL